MVKNIAFVLLLLLLAQESTWALSVGGARPLRQRGNSKNSTEDQKKKQEQEDKTHMRVTYKKCRRKRKCQISIPPLLINLNLS